MRLFHLSTEFTKKEKKKQKEKETTTATNLNFYKFCVDKREQYLSPLLPITRGICGVAYAPWPSAHLPYGQTSYTPGTLKMPFRLVRSSPSMACVIL